MENYNNQNETRRKTALPPKNNQAMAAMTFSMCALLSTFCCFLPGGLLLGVLGIVMAILSRKGEPMSGYAIAAMIMGILSVAANLAVFACMMLAYYFSESPVYGPMFNDMVRQYQQFYETMPTP